MQNPVIQARLGHATITETMDTYGHLFPDAEDLGRGAAGVGSMTGEPSVGCLAKQMIMLASR